MSLATLDSCESLPTEPDCRGPALAPARPIGGRETLEFDLALKHAGPRRVRLAIEWCGDVALPAVWVAGGISADRHVCANRTDTTPGWWQELIDSEAALDPDRLCLLACSWLGSDGELDVPLSTEDQADAIARALDRLGIPRLAAFVGASYGGMVGQAFAARYPRRLERLVCLSAGSRPHPFASAFRALQRQIVTFGQAHADARQGLSLARQFAMLSYRSPTEFAQRFNIDPQLGGDRARCGAEDYLRRCGERYSERWSATAFLRLSESIDLHVIDPARIRVPTHLLAVVGDWLAPPEDLEVFARTIAAPAHCERIESLYGHDAFLKETARVGELISRALDAHTSAEVH
jgi:homoserine O-acetyltransferase